MYIYNIYLFVVCAQSMFGGFRLVFKHLFGECYTTNATRRNHFSTIIIFCMRSYKITIYIHCFYLFIFFTQKQFQSQQFFDYIFYDIIYFVYLHILYLYIYILFFFVPSQGLAVSVQFLNICLAKQNPSRRAAPFFVLQTISTHT